MRSDGATGSPSSTWEDLLDSIAPGGQRLVLETASGQRVVLIAESEPTLIESAAADSGRPAPASAGVLTDREIEVRGLVAQGLSGAEAAARLGLASNTVAQHLTSVRRKLGVHSRSAAAEAARSMGILLP